MDLKKVYKNLNRLDVEKIMINILKLKKTNEFISDLNRNQLVSGVNDDGDKLEPEYSESTIWTKQTKSGISGITDRVTLYNKGYMHESIFADIHFPTITMGSHDEKIGLLTTKYGEFLGLTKDSIEKLKDYILPIFYTKLHAAIFR